MVTGDSNQPPKKRDNNATVVLLRLGPRNTTAATIRWMNNSKPHTNMSTNTPRPDSQDPHHRNVEYTHASMASVRNIEGKQKEMEKNQSRHRKNRRKNPQTHHSTASSPGVFEELPCCHNQNLSTILVRENDRLRCPMHRFGHTIELRFIAWCSPLQTVDRKL